MVGFTTLHPFDFDRNLFNFLVIMISSLEARLKKSVKVAGTACLTTKIKMATLREPLQIFTVLAFLEIQDT